MCRSEIDPSSAASVGGLRSTGAVFCCEAADPASSTVSYVAEGKDCPRGNFATADAGQCGEQQLLSDFSSTTWNAPVTISGCKYTAITAYQCEETSAPTPTPPRPTPTPPRQSPLETLEDMVIAFSLIIENLDFSAIKTDMILEASLVENYTDHRR